MAWLYQIRIKARSRQVSLCLYLLLLVTLVIACSTAGGQFQAGRQALLRGEPEIAVTYFTAAADQNPNYVYVIENYRQSVWTDLGRAQYETKRYPEARRSLEKALSLNREDSMAMLYLGLTLIRTGDLSTGERYIGRGTKGLYDWIEYMNRTRPYEDFWDPTRQIRKQIDQVQASISSRDPDPEQIVSATDWIGKMFEEELDRVRRDQSRELDRDGDDGDGHR